MQPICLILRATYQLPLIRRTSSFNAYTHVYNSRIRTTHTANSPESRLSGSAKLFADAEKEEAEAAAAAAEAAKPFKLSHLEQEHENWTGDESIKDAVLRMLVDKYKPLRTGTIQTAEQKLKKSPPELASGTFENVTPLPTVKLTPTTGSWALEPLLPSSEGHQPWHTEFKAPKHETAAIKLAHMPIMISSKPSTASPPPDERARRLEREKLKRTQQANKLADARESTLDYRLGIRNVSGRVRRPNPTSLKGWTSLIEDKIEKARKAGVFNTVQGRGKPLARSAAEFNPFIAREEFLMNRIVQKNGAAPPWVEIQIELENSVNTFRHILQQSWIRRATRGLAMEHPPKLLHRLTLQDIERYRDPDWIAKEKSYHETAVNQLNSVVRKYNGVAPYAVRRSYYTREAEIDKLYIECAPDILRAISDRAKEMNVGLDGSSGGESSESSGSSHVGNPSSLNILGFVSFIQWLRALFRRWFGVGV